MLFGQESKNDHNVVLNTSICLLLHKQKKNLEKIYWRHLQFLIKHLNQIFWYFCKEIVDYFAANNSTNLLAKNSQTAIAVWSLKVAPVWPNKPY